MKTRLVPGADLWRACILCLALLVAALATNGCKTTAADLPIEQFGAIRVMNFAESPATSPSVVIPMDFYIDPAGAIPDSLAKIHGLSYGVASVYTDNLPTATTGTAYNLRATPIGQPNKTLASTTVVLMPEQRFTWIIKSDDGVTFQGIPIVDGGTPTAGTTQAYVRFINLQPGSGDLDLKVGNAGGPSLFAKIAYPNATPYQGLLSVTDTSYTFFVTPNGATNILARLAFVSFTPNSFYTVVYSGDLARTGANGRPSDPADSLRIRIFDDNFGGSDMTNPVPSSLRYNIVNGIIGTAPPLTYDPASLFGFALNKDQNAKYKGFTFPATGPLTAMPGWGARTPDPSGAVVQDVPFAATFLTPVLELQAWVATPSGSNYLFLDAHLPHNTTNPTAALKSDQPVSFVVFDTFPHPKVQTPAQLIADSGIFKHTLAVAITDVPPGPGMATFVTVNAITYSPGNAGQTTPYYLTASISGVTPPLLANATQGRSATKVDVAAGAPVTLTGSVGNTNPVKMPDFTFTPVDGGIYEVLAVGQKGNADPALQPHFIVLHTNP